ncbi:ARM repeat-containing protein [Hypoxylon sp. EC38]|nr:ARM repeat-containing protein [Hypoxylon sp. EC38]
MKRRQAEPRQDPVKRLRIEHRSPTAQPFARDRSTQSSELERAVRFRHVNPPSEDENKNDADVDIIAIHGLDTKSPDTWVWKDLKNPLQPTVNWLEDQNMLPALVGRARILTCDWPADLYESSQLIPRTIDEFARLLLDGIQSHTREDRPILFIASCLGGIILMKALDMASQEYSSIRAATRGVIFLATPFRGTSFQDVAAWVEPLLKKWASIRSENVTSLLHNTTQSFDLSELVRRFTQLCKDQEYEIFTFYERGVTDLSRKLPRVLGIWWSTPKPLVDQSSATLDIVAHPLSLDRSHVLMNKFQGPDKDSDPDYAKVSEKVECFLKKIREGTLLEKADVYMRDKHYTKIIFQIQRLSGEYLSMDQCYINLAIVEQLGKERSGSLSSPFSLSARWKVETPAEKLQVKLPRLFEPYKMLDGSMKKPRRILIRGRAGIGKTTLCKKIVHDFNHGNMWKGLFKRVLWVPLRNLKSNKPRNFEELFHHEYFIRQPEGEDHARRLSSALAKALKTVDERTLFVLDGLDEVQNWNGEQDNESLFFSELLNQPDVIITTRPHAIFPTGFTQPDLELETVGFYPNQVQHYLKKVVKDPLIVRDIQLSLRKHWLIRSLVRIPIQLDAFCLSWNDISKNPIPETMTTIYEAIVFRLWKKDIVRLRGKKPGPYYTHARPWEIEENTIPERELLERFAFSGMYSNLVEFQPEHQDAVHKLVQPSRVNFSFHDRLGRLSFLRASDPSADASNQSYHFLHLTFQEFFAAQYFVRQWKPKKCLEYLDLNSKTLSTFRVNPVDFLNQNKYSSRYDIVWRFTVGLFDSKVEVPEFFDQLENGKRLDLLGPTHQRLVRHCLCETDNSTYLESRPELVNNLSQWLLVECDLMGPSFFVADTQIPDQLFQTALKTVDKDIDKTVQILRALKWSVKRYLSDATIEYLLALLQNADSVDVQYASMEALVGRSNLSKDTIMKLVKLLQDDNANVDARDASAKLIGNQVELPEEIVTTLLTLLQNENATTQTFAAKALGEHSNLSKGAITAIVALLECANSDIDARTDIERETQWKFQVAVCKALEKQSNLMEKAAGILENLQELLGSSHHKVRYAVATILKNQRKISEQTATALVKLIKDDNDEIRNIAIKALSKHSDLSEQPAIALVQLLKDTSNWMIRNDVADTLNTQSKLSQNTHNILETLLQNADASIQYFAAKALGLESDLPNETFIDLMPFLENTDWNIRNLATKALQKKSDLPKQSITTLIRHLEAEDSETRKCATKILRTQSNLEEEDIMSLVKLLENANLEHNEWDMEFPRLFLEDNAEVLDRQPDLTQPVISSLLALVKNPNKYWNIRRRAARILGEQSNLSEIAILTLVAALGNENDIRVGFTIAKVLTDQSNLPKKAIIDLKALLKDQREDIQSAAAVALSNRPNLPEEIPNDTIMAIIRAILFEDSDINYDAYAALEFQSRLTKEAPITLVEQLQSDDWRYSRDFTDILQNKSNLPENAMKALIRGLRYANERTLWRSIRVLGGQFQVSKKTAKVFVKMLRGADRHEVSRAIGHQPIFLEKVLRVLTSAPIHSFTMKYLYGSLIYRSFHEQCCLQINEDSSLLINQPSGSLIAYIFDDDSHERLSYEQLSREVLKWKEFWGVP